MKSFLLLTWAVVSLAKRHANQLKLVDDNSDSIFLESTSASNTIGYGFSLYQNVLTIMVNATSSNGKVEPARYAVLPNLILEYNSTIPASNTTSITGFLDKANDNKDWGKGLKVAQHGDVYEITGNWTDPDNHGRPKFQTKMYVTDKKTKFNGINLQPNEVTMFFSILNYKFTLDNSSLAFDEILLSAVTVENSTVGELVEFSSGPAAMLIVNDTALVDGKGQKVTAGSLADGNLDIVVGNSTNLNITGLVAQNVLLTFANSHGAKNVTFEERLQLNLTALNNMSGMEENAAFTVKAPRWIGAILTVAFLTLALPIIF